jgi:FkbM family methyltransferase
MSISQAQERILTGAYSAIRRTGVLGTAPGRVLFLRAYFLYKRFAEDNLHALLRRYPGLARGGNLFDIGANVGYTASVLASAADVGCKVYAFEPEPFNVALLESVAARHANRGIIVPFASAVGAHQGTVALWRNERHHADHRVVTPPFRPDDGAHLPVPVTTLDSFVAAHPGPVALVKIDVQGYELPVCQGMLHLLEANPSVTVVLEYMPSAMESLGFAPQELLALFAQRGFAGHTLQRDGTLLPGEPVIPQGQSYVDLVFRREPLPPEVSR